MSNICPNCGEEKTGLATHWNSKRCEHPHLSDKQKEIITGVLMSDGYLRNHQKQNNASIKVDSINKEYLTYLDKTFGALSTGEPTCNRTAEEINKRKKIPRFENSTYQDLYRWRSRSLPELNKWESWYNSGEKVWPKDITLTPTVLKHLYAGDGSKCNNNMRIYLSNERKNKTKVNKYFTDAGLPKPRWNDYERCDGSICSLIRWRVEESKEILEYMGEPISGHEYKW